MSEELDALKDKWLARADRLLGYPYLRMRFRRQHFRFPNLRNPRGYGEKIQWRKLYDRNPLFPVLSDKLRAPDYVRDILGAEAEPHMPRLLYKTDDPATLPFDDFGQGVIIKANHGSGWNIFCPPGEEIDRAQVIKTCQGWLNRSFALRRQEWAYSQIKPMILVEEMLNAGGPTPRDYKLHMFGRNHAMTQVIDRNSQPNLQGYFDHDWARMDVQPVTSKRTSRVEMEDVQPPMMWDKMLDFAQRLAEPLDAVRVDFLLTDDWFWIGELTLYRGSGFDAYQPYDWEYRLGDMWTLPEKNGNKA